MPFVYDETQVEHPDDGTELPPPRAEQFVYLPAPEFGGPREPVRFAVSSPDAPGRRAGPEPPTQPSPPAPTQPTEQPKRGFMQRLLGRPASAPRSAQSSFQERQRAAQEEQARRLQQLLDIMVPALQEVGARRVYCRYDGGNDEGWAWFDSVELRTGERINFEALAQRLQDIDVHTKLSAIGFKLQDFGPMQDGAESAKKSLLENVVSGWLCQEWATMLLGRGFGTGEYSMYGAFTVDLETCTISDDPGADPVVENIRVAR